MEHAKIGRPPKPEGTHHTCRRYSLTPEAAAILDAIPNGARSAWLSLLVQRFHHRVPKDVLPSKQSET